MKLIISLAQMNVVSGDLEGNLEKGSCFIAEAKKRHSHLIVFPELWTTGFNWSFNHKIIEEHKKVIPHIAKLAKLHQIWIHGSVLAENEEKKMSNTSILFTPLGQENALYRKTHLFSLLGEEKHMAPGKCLTLAKTPWGKSGLSICYDIRFPELFRSYALEGAKIIFSPAAFPHPRLEHWKILLRARAIENQLFMVGVNQVGKGEIYKGKQISFFGHSAIIDPWGNTVIEGSENNEELLTTEIDMDIVDSIRKEMTVFNDRRPEIYTAI